MQRSLRHSAYLPFEPRCAMEGKRICNNYLQSQRASKAKAADFCKSRAVSHVLAAAEENLAWAKPVGRLVPEAALFPAKAGEQSKAKGAEVEGSVAPGMSCVHAALPGTGLVERGRQVLLHF